MQLNLSRTRNLFLGGASVLLTACVSNPTPTKPAVANSGNASARFDDFRAPGGLDPDLRLFGQAPLGQDVSFEGKAAVNIQQHTTPSEGADFDPAIDSAGKSLIFASTRHSRFSHLYLKQIDGASLTQITDERANDAQPAFRFDGKKIAFASDRAGQWDIWITDANGRSAMQITTSPMAELHPTWSYDGKRLAYCRMNSENGQGELWVVDVDNPGTKRFIGEGMFPSWSPRADRIAYQRARQRGSRWFSIWTITLENGEPLPPTEVASSSEWALIAPTWSPDGAQLAFVTIQPPPVGKPAANRAPPMRHSEIAMIDADGRGMMRLTNGRGENYAPCWSSDDRIFFTARLEKSETIWSIRPFRPAPAAPPPPTVTENRRSAEGVDLEEALP